VYYSIRDIIGQPKENPPQRVFVVLRYTVRSLEVDF
jgi:hypothetical protein